MEKLLLAFVDTLDALLKKTLAEIGEGTGFTRLTINQFHYIEAIHALGEPSISEVAKKLHITKASVTAGVNKLARLGYVTKTQSSEDRRVFHVRITPASGQLIEAKERALRNYVSFIRAALTEAEAKQFEATLSRLVSRFGQNQ
jgi:DNA-binding MarR family transcriptional regulator